jgi:quercetin dioxygenase-like cupin family protein
MGAFSDLGTITPQRIWDGVLGWMVHGEKVTFSLVELEPAVTVPVHSHANEQLGLVLEGSLTFTIGDEVREVGRGEAWCITGHVPHSVVCGPDGAVLIEVFSPVREDWMELESVEPRTPRWPA